MPRSVVIGANGFLGSHLVDELDRRGHVVTAFDRFSSGTATFASTSAIQIVGDFTNKGDVAAAVRNQDYVFHFVSTTTPVSAENDPTLDVRTNIASSIDLLTLSVDAGVSRFYFASTGGAIYGDQSDVIPTETTLPQPVSPYAIAKLAIEGYLRYFHRKFGLESVAFRISNPYGPGQHPSKLQGVIPIFLSNMKRGLPVTIFGDGSMVRDYLYVSDAVRMIADVVDVRSAHDLYNVGSGIGTSVAEVLQAARAVTGIDPEVLVAAVPPTFVRRSVLSVDRYQAEFGAARLLTLHEGIAATWAAIDGAEG